MESCINEVQYCLIPASLYRSHFNWESLCRVSWVVKKLRFSCGLRGYITAFQTARHLPPTWIKWIPFTNYFFKFYLNITPGLQRGICSTRSRDSVVGIATSYGLHGLGFGSRRDKKFPFLQKRPYRVWDLPSLLFNSSRKCVLVSLPRERTPWLKFSHLHLLTKLRITAAVSLPPPPMYSIMVWTGTKDLYYLLFRFHSQNFV